MFRGQENVSSNRWWFSFADDSKMEELYYLLTQYIDDRIKEIIQDYLRDFCEQLEIKVITSINGKNDFSGLKKDIENMINEALRQN